MGVSFSGDWDKLTRVLDRVATKHKSAQARAIGRSLKKVERRVLSHLDMQDLGWEALSDDYAESKKKKNLSPDILRATNEMYQNVTSTQPSAWKGMVGVQRGVKTDAGEELTDIALIHEQPEDDGDVIPARKLWQPTFEEMKDEIAAELMGTTIRVFKK